MKDYNHGDWEIRRDRSSKTCCCGGHNGTNRSRHLGHHGTRKRNEHRRGRKLRERQREEAFLGSDE